ncbi:MAG: hypothetical protein R3E64_17640 [Halioglobus sp.]
MRKAERLVLMNRLLISPDTMVLNLDIAFGLVLAQLNLSNPGRMGRDWPFHSVMAKQLVLFSRNGREVVTLDLIMVLSN